MNRDKPIPIRFRSSVLNRHGRSATHGAGIVALLLAMGASFFVPLAVSAPAPESAPETAPESALGSASGSALAASADAADMDATDIDGAVSGAASATAINAGFNPDFAFADIEAQCALGPRIPGTDAHRAARDWIAGRLGELGYRVWIQGFQDRNPLTGEEVEAWNIWGLPEAWWPNEVDGVVDDLGDNEAVNERAPNSKPPVLHGGEPDSFILLSAHWDTRPWADEEAPPWDRSPFPGANDGGSGVAVALEVARALKGTGLEDRVALVFYDLEDSGLHGDVDTWSRGAQFAVADLPPWFSELRVGINLDMVAGEDLVLRREGHGTRAAPGPTRRLWAIGRKLAPEVFLNESRRGVIDDHYFFARQGWPYIDLIGMPYRHWHRLGDTPSHCDPRSMGAVGRVLIEYIESEFGR